MSSPAKSFFVLTHSTRHEFLPVGGVGLKTQLETSFCIHNAEYLLSGMLALYQEGIQLSRDVGNNSPLVACMASSGVMNGSQQTGGFTFTVGFISSHPATKAALPSAKL